MIEIENNEQDIISSNFWDSELARRGYYFLSFNVGAVRLLVPDNLLPEVEEMKTGKAVIISQGTMNGKEGATEILFEDYTENPYSIHIDPAQTDRWLPATDAGRDLQFSAWGRNAVKLFERPAKFRKVEKLPCLEPWRA